MAEHAADTEQFPWSQHAPFDLKKIPFTEQFFIRNKKSGPEPVPYLEFLLYISLNRAVNHKNCVLPWYINIHNRVKR